MITWFRRLFSTRLGAFLALAFVVLVGFAFALSDVTGSSNFGGAGGGNAARVGDQAIGIGQLRSQVERQYEQAREKQPDLTLAQFVADGGVERALDGMIDGVAFDLMARELGFGASKRLVDGRIADLPVFRGVTGQFDQSVMNEFLRREGLTERELREDLARQILLEQFAAPIGTSPRISPALAMPYAALMLETRVGEAAFVPASRFAPSRAPTDAELTAFLAANRARYVVPERRQLRYAVFDRSSVPAQTVSDAEIAAAYKASGDRFAARETRRLSQVIAPDQTIANAIAASARRGGTLGAAARMDGLAATSVTADTQAKLAASAGAEAARAAFAAAEGAVVGPVQGSLGWVVLRIEDVTATPARSLADARADLETQLLDDKRNEAMVDLYNGIQDAVNRGASFDEIVEENRLKVETTPAILPSGRAPGQPGYAFPPALAAILPQVFQGSEGDVQLDTVRENEVFAVVDIDKVMPAAPPPLANIRDTLVTDWRLDQGARAARTVARGIVTAVEGGRPLADAVRVAGPGLGSVQRVGARRADLARGGARVPPEIALLFSMAPRTVKTLELPGDAGWMVIRLNQVDRPADNQVDPQLVGAVTAQLGPAMGNEWVQQAIGAARKRAGVERNANAIDTLKRELAGNLATGE